MEIARNENIFLDFTTKSSQVPSMLSLPLKKRVDRIHVWEICQG